MSFAKLPELCLLITFDQLPVRDLPKVSLVCHSWNGIAKISARNRRTLTIIISNQENDITIWPITSSSRFHYIPSIWKLGPEDTQLRYINFSRRVCKLLIATFPNIAMIKFDFNSLLPWIVKERINYLLSRWSSKLVSIRLAAAFINCYRAEYYQSMVKKLVDLTIQMPSLKELSFDCRENLFYHNEIGSAHIDIPVLARLERFHFNTMDSISIIMGSLVKVCVLISV